VPHMANAAATDATENCNERLPGGQGRSPAALPRAPRQGPPHGRLQRVWRRVRANRGAAGIDRQTIERVERCGVAGLVDELEVDLTHGGLPRAAPSSRNGNTPPSREGGIEGRPTPSQ
jgi:hypothetical protein